MKNVKIPEGSYVNDTQSLVAGPTYKASPIARKNAAIVNRGWCDENEPNNVNQKMQKPFNSW